MASFEHLDFRAAVEAERREAELLGEHEAYLDRHTELREVMHELTQALLIHKPEDPLAYIQEYVDKHRERRAAYQVK